jgi:type IV pilus assembly protein PilO
MSNLVDQIRELDPNDPGRWPLAFRIGATALIFVIALIGIGYFWAYRSKQPELDAAKAKEQELLGTLEQKARKAANLDAYRAQLAEIEKSFGTMLRKLPNNTEVPNLITDISKEGSAAGLDQNQKLFQPASENIKDFYAELPIKMQLTGSFHSIGAFVSGVAALPRIVTLHDIEITPLTKPATGNTRASADPTGTDELQLDFTAKTYRYLDEEEQAAAQASAKPAQPGRPKPAG